MADKSSLLFWAPRLLAIGICLFVTLFALDAFESGEPAMARLGDFMIHLLPSALVLLVVMLSWRRDLIGGVGFVLLAVAYAWMARSRIDWVLAISGPLLMVAILFLWSWRAQRYVTVT